MATAVREAGLVVVLAAFVLGANMGGCQQTPSSQCQGDCPTEEVEPNGTFRQSRVVSFTVEETATLTGEVGSLRDIDVFDLGPAEPGDRVRLSTQVVSGRLRAALALYNSDGELINEDTLTSLISSTGQPTIDHVVRVATRNLYMAISHNIDGVSRGQYEIAVDIQRGGTVPQPRAQVILLNFTGGSFQDSLFGTIEAGPFDAGDIDAAYAGQTEAMKASIVDTFLENYSRFEVVVLDSVIDTPPADGEFSEILFGGFNGFAFGASESVDLYNGDPSDRAIIFTESFEPFLFGGVPTATELGVAIGNVAAHEMGHLLGLHHVNDATALMDEASPSATLLEDQEFKSAPLSDSIFPLGRQDAVDLLRVILGPSSSPQGHLSPGVAGAFPEERPRKALFLEPTTPGRAKCLNCLRRAEMARWAASMGESTSID